MGVFRKTDRPQIDIVDQGDNTSRIYLNDPNQDTSAYGSDINEELYTDSQQIDTRPDTFPTSEYPADNPGLMWWVKDLEIYIPLITHFNHIDGGSDGGMKVYMFSDDTTLGSFTGADVEAAFNSGKAFSSPMRAKDYGNKSSLNYWGNTNQSWLPVLEGSNVTSVQNVEDLLILDFGYNDDSGDNAEGNYITNVCEDFFSPPVYEYRENMGNNRFHKYHGFFQSDEDAQQFFGNPTRRDMIGFNLAYTNPQPSTSNKFDGSATYIDLGPDSQGVHNTTKAALDGDDGTRQERATVSYSKPNSNIGSSGGIVGFGKLGMIGDERITTDGQTYSFPERTSWKRVRNSVMPYCKDIVVKTNQHVNGGSFRCSSDGGFGYGGNAEEVNSDRTTGQGAYGRQRLLSSGFQIDRAFPQGLENFSMNAGVGPDQAGYYYIAVCVGYEFAELNGDDVTNAQWTLYKISKNDVYNFLNNKSAQFLVYYTQQRVGFNSPVNQNVTGMYNTKRVKITSQNNLANNGNIFVGSAEDNFGVGDESDGYFSNDRKARKGSMAAMTVVFRKPNPFRPFTDDQDPLVTQDINNRIRLGIDTPTFNIVKGDKLFLETYNSVSPSLPGYTPFHETNLRYKFNPSHLLNYGFWNKESITPVTNELNSFKPLVYSFTVDINDSTNTSNQVYYSDESEEFIKTSIPANVGFVCDIFENQNLINEDPSQITFSDFSKVSSQGFDHFVDNNGIGYKWALVQADRPDRLSIDELLTMLNTYYTSPNSLSPIIKKGLFNFQDIFTVDENNEIVFSQINKGYQLPGLHINTFLVYKYHSIFVDGIAYIQPIQWSAVTTSMFLSSTGYYIEDFSELGGPGFTTLPYPDTTPIISGLSPASDYIRSVDDIFDANLFTSPQILDRIKIKNVINNEELGGFLGDSDLGQTRIFNRPVRMRQLIGIDETDRPYNDYDFYIGEEDLRYPINSAATSVFIDTVDNLRDKCIVELNPGIQTKGLLRDSSGNENKGIIIGDYALTKDDRETELQRDSNMKTPNVNSTYKAF